VVQGRQKQDQRRSAGPVDPARQRSQRGPTRQSRRNFPREIRGEIRLVAAAGLALVSEIGVILVHQSNVHKRVSAHYTRLILIFRRDTWISRRADLGVGFYFARNSPSSPVSGRTIAFVTLAILASKRRVNLARFHSSRVLFINNQNRHVVRIYRTNAITRRSISLISPREEKRREERDGERSELDIKRDCLLTRTTTCTSLTTRKRPRTILAIISLPS